jgi:hypothetical protein
MALEVAPSVGLIFLGAGILGFAASFG